ncbi:hypothetical protein [Streptomyces cavernae]|nr:hypothetical protein [Streptomyces cavernae]
MTEDGDSGAAPTHEPAAANVLSHHQRLCPTRKLHVRNPRALTSLPT